MPFRWRPDGDDVRDVPATRRIMPFIMRQRNEAIVFFEQKVDTSKTWAFLREFRDRTGLHATMLHLLIWAAGQIFKARPRLNRFTAGGRIFQCRCKTSPISLANLVVLGYFFTVSHRAKRRT